jgi:hypothetical protein
LRRDFGTAADRWISHLLRLRAVRVVPELAEWLLRGRA